jgi:phenylacetate-CoA ligase
MNGAKSMPWNKSFECMPVEKMRDFQLKMLQNTVKWAYENIPFYRKKLKDEGIEPSDIRSLDDLISLPFTVKDDLRDNYPFGLCGVPLEDVVRIHCSSGTTGKPITALYTSNDIEGWTECMARALWSAGVRKNDLLQDAHGYGLFTGGFGFLQGATRIGCAVVPSSSGQTERQVILMKDFGTTVLCCTPSYALTIAERAEEMGVDIKRLPLRLGVFGAEPWTKEVRKEIEERMGIDAHEVYGLTELLGPGVSFDCEEKDGLHVNEDYILPEIIDPVTLQPKPDGTQGELVFTSLQRRAMPMIRYRTRDISRLRRERCTCGRTLIKMDKVLGRSDDMLIISGVNVFPSQIESLLLDIPEVEPQYTILVTKKGYLDHLTINVEGKQAIYESGPERISYVEKKIQEHIRGMIGIRVDVKLVDPKTIARSEGKAKRVIDQRGSGGERAL